MYERNFMIVKQALFIWMGLLPEKIWHSGVWKGEMAFDI